MASPRSVSAKPLASADRRYRRSAFNGAKQLSAAQAPSRRILVLLGLLVLGLVSALAVIIGVQVLGDKPGTASTPSTHQAAR